MGSGGRRVAATQAEMSPPPPEHQALMGEFGVLSASVVLSGHPWLCRQPAVPGPSAGHALPHLCSPPFLPTMLPRPEETSVAGKAPPSPCRCCMLRSAWLHPACLWLLHGARACLWQAGRQGWLWHWCPVLPALGDRCGGFAVLCPALRAGVLLCGVGDSELLVPGAELPALPQG